MTIAERLAAVKERIARAAQRAGRRPEDVRLVVVTKTHAAEAVAELLAAGHDLFGESRVQEALPKIDALGARGRWHLIGHLQRNKAAQAVGRFEMIESVDSVRLIEELEKRAAAKDFTQRILIEVNVGDDPNKTGAPPDDLPPLLEALARAPHLKGEGLMTVPPYSDDAEASRPHFARLRELLRSLPPSPNFEPRQLSMGMSGDFEVAIEEGATIVRVGTAIMGTRG